MVKIALIITLSNTEFKNECRGMLSRKPKEDAELKKNPEVGLNI